MGKKDPRVDAYIAKSADFARPILERIREQVHAVCPEVEETMKWSFPHFDYRGIICSMASFKEHCALGFWKGDLILSDDEKKRDAMGHFGRIRSVKDLPSKADFARYLKKAMRLNEEGVKAPRRAPATVKSAAPVEVPDDLTAALRKNRAAKAVFDAFPPSHKREYTAWITEAKRADTRKRRLEQAIEWMTEGKARNWKYMKK